MKTFLKMAVLGASLLSVSALYAAKVCVNNQTNMPILAHVQVDKTTVEVKAKATKKGCKRLAIGQKFDMKTKYDTVIFAAGGNNVIAQCKASTHDAKNLQVMVGMIKGSKKYGCQ